MTDPFLLMTILWMTINIFLTKILLLKPMKLAPRQIYVSYYDYVVSLKRNCIFYLYFSASNVWTNLSMATRYKCEETYSPSSCLLSVLVASLQWCTKCWHLESAKQTASPSAAHFGKKSRRT